MNASEPPSGDGPTSVGDQIGRRPNGTFVKGAIGNPKGRARGSRNIATLAMEGLLSGKANKIAKKALAAAEAGEPWAITLVMRLLMPVPRDGPVKIALQRLAPPPMCHAPCARSSRPLRRAG